MGKKKGNSNLQQAQGAPPAVYMSYPTGYPAAYPQGVPAMMPYPGGMMPMAPMIIAAPQAQAQAQGQSQPQPQKKSVKSSILGCPGFERCHPCAWIPCSPYARRLQKKGAKIKTGYKPDRWPTDILCLFFFVMFWVGMVIIACYGVWSGNPLSLLLPTDYQDNICGYEKGEGNHNLYDLSNKTVLWFPFSFDTDISEIRFIDALYMGICVEQCPTEYLGQSYKNILANFASYKSNITESMIFCNYNLDNLTYSEKIDRIEQQDGCYVNIFPTNTFQKRCVPFFPSELNITLPSNAQYLIDTFMKAGNTIKAGFYEIRIAWFPLVLNGIITLILCFGLAFFINTGFLKIFAAFMIVTTWCVMVGFTGFCGWAAYNRWVNATKNGIRDKTTTAISITFMVIGGIFLILDILYLCIVVFLFRRIKKAADIIQLAAKPLFKIPTLLIVPIITFFCLVGITAYWLLIAGYIQSATLPITLKAPDLSQLPISSLPFNVSSAQKYEYTIRRGDATIQGLQWYHLFGYLWTSAFLSAIGYTTTAGVISQWYFSCKGNPEANYANVGVDFQKRSEFLSVPRSFLRAIIFHSGSLLFGSILVAIVQFIRFIYRRIEAIITKAFALATCGNPAIIALVCCIKCFVRFLFLGFYLLVKFFNKNAYIMMMIHGGSFLNSGARAFELIKENIVLVGTTNFIGHAMLFLGQAVITIWGAFQTYIIIYLFETYEARLVMGEVVYYVIPVLAGLVTSFVISGMFVNMYTTAIDTVILCYLEDRKVRKVFPYTPPPLREDSFFQMLTPPCLNRAKYLVKKLNKKQKKQTRSRKTN